MVTNGKNDRGLDSSSVGLDCLHHLTSQSVMDLYIGIDVHTVFHLRLPRSTKMIPSSSASSRAVLFSPERKTSVRASSVLEWWVYVDIYNVLCVRSFIQGLHYVLFYCYLIQKKSRSVACCDWDARLGPWWCKSFGPLSQHATTILGLWGHARMDLERRGFKDLTWA